MKKSIIFLAIASLSAPVMAEESWFDSLKNFIGLGDSSQVASEAVSENLPNTNEIVSVLTESLSISSDQASGGLGALLNLVKSNISQEQFNQLTQSLPGVDKLINNMPDISELKSTEGLSGLLDKASQYSESLKGVNDLKKQFESLGLNPEMITDFVSTAQTYLDTEQGKEAKEILSQGISKLIG
jgi:hypothetical protein